MAAINRVANNLGSFTSGKVLPSSSQLGINTSLPLAHLDRENANATFVFLCRNDDINGVVSSVQQVEDRFNRRHQYPWVFLNEEPFTEEFKTCIYLLNPSIFLFKFISYRRVRVLTDAPIHFGLIPPEHWYQPEWIDENLARLGRLRMMGQGIIYGGTLGFFVFV